MKHLKELNESFKLFTQDRTPEEAYNKRAYDHAYHVAMRETQISEKSLDMLDRLKLVLDSLNISRETECATIIAHSKQRKFRPEYCGEILYHTIYQGKIDALKERDWINGGLKN